MTMEYVFPPQQRVLVVDDEPDACMMIEMHLHGMCQVSTVQSGEDAWRLLQDEQFSLVVLDLMMPGMTGEELLVQMNKAGMLTRTKVVVNSAKGGDASKLKCLQGGAVTYLEKTFDPGLLAAQVRVMLGMQSSIVHEQVLTAVRVQNARGGYGAQQLADRMLAMSTVLTKDMQGAEVDFLQVIHQQLCGSHGSITLQASLLRAVVVGNACFLQQAVACLFEHVRQYGRNIHCMLAIQDGLYHLVLRAQCRPLRQPPFTLDIANPAQPWVGLPLAREAALRHKGDLTMEIDGTYTIFTFTIPTADRFRTHIQPTLAAASAAE